MEASELFVRAFSNCGTICGTCDCGVTHFAAFCPEDFDPQELQSLRDKSRLQPDKFKEHDCSSLVVVHIDGKQFVDGCACGKLRVYEDWIWNYRDQIAQYLMTRLTHQLTSVERTMQVLRDYQQIKKPGCIVPDLP